MRREFRTEGREEIIENMEEIIDKSGEWGGFTVFTGHSLFDTPSGGSIFRCTTKDRGERRAKGLRPLESPG